MRHLFIGGPHDGEWHEVEHPDRHIVQLAEYQPIAAFKPEGYDTGTPYNEAEMVTCRHDYLRKCIRGERNSVVIYIHSELTMDAAIAAMIRKYPCSTPTRPA